MKARDERVSLMNEVGCAFHIISDPRILIVFVDPWWNPYDQGNIPLSTLNRLAKSSSTVHGLGA